MNRDIEMQLSPLILLSCFAALACGDPDDESAEETKEPYTCVIVQNDPYHCNCEYQDPANLGNEIVVVCELPSTTGVCCIDVSRLGKPKVLRRRPQVAGVT